jgi:hypothetical protein
MSDDKTKEEIEADLQRQLKELDKIIADYWDNKDKDND